MQVIQLQDERNFVRGFALPPLDGVSYIALRSNVSVTRGNIAYPRLMLLDEQFAPLIVVQDPHYTYTQSWTENDGLETHLAIPQEYRQARYALIYTSNASLRGATTPACKWNASIIVIGKIPVSTGGGQSCVNLFVSPVGTVSIELVAK